LSLSCPSRERAKRARSSSNNRRSSKYFSKTVPDLLGDVLGGWSCSNLLVAVWILSRLATLLFWQACSQAWCFASSEDSFSSGSVSRGSSAPRTCCPTRSQLSGLFASHTLHAGKRGRAQKAASLTCQGIKRSKASAPLIKGVLLSRRHTRRQSNWVASS